MTPLFDKLPGLDLSCNMVITDTFQIRDAGAAIIYAQEAIASRFAKTIAKEQKLFTAKEQQRGYLIDVRADCVVLTKDELRDALSDMFRRGTRYGDLGIY